MTITTSRPVRILAVCLVPLVAAGVLVWATSNRQQRIDKIPVAIVNSDKIITSPQKMAAGRSLTAALTEPSKPEKNLQWTVTDSADAKSGLANGDYYAVLTIPSDFSKAILSSGGNKPTRGQLSLVSNSAASVTVPYISEKVASAAADSLGVQTTQGYLKNVYQGFNQVASSNKKSASSASQLASGTGQLSTGAGHLDNGASSLAGSLVQLQSGAVQLQSGAVQVRTGAVQVRSGADSVASGAGNVSQGTGNVASGASQLHRGAKKLAGSAGKLAGSSKRLAGAAGGVAAGASGLASADSRLAKADRLLAAELAVLSRLCVPAGAGARFCAAVDRAHQHALTLTGAAHRLAGRSASLAGASHGVATGTRKVAHGNQQLASGARALSGSSAHLSQGAHRVHHGAISVASGAASVASGAASVASGAASVDQAAGSLAAGTSKAASGGASVASGASSVNSSAGSVDHGANQLSSGLAKGAKESPTYSGSLQKSLENTVAQPVDLSHSLQHDGHGNGWLMAALVALVLWLAAVAGALRGDPGASLNQSAAPVSSRRLAFSRLLPVLGLAVIEAAGVLVALLLLNVGAADVVGFVLMTVVAALAFTAVAYATRLVLGRAGLAALVVVLIVQLAALGNVIPLETAPGPLRTLNSVLPLSAYVDGASQLLTGGSVGSRFVDLLVLIAWGVAGCVATVLTIRRRRLEPRTAPPAPTQAAPATPAPAQGSEPMTASWSR